MSVIPEKELTLQYKQLENASTNEEFRKPSVADGKELKLFVQNVKNIFQKEPNFIPKQRSPQNHNEGARTLVTDTVKANHKFEIEAYVYMSRDKGFSLPRKTDGSGNLVSAASPDGIIIKRDDRFFGQITQETLTIDPSGPQLDEFFFVGDTEIVHDSEDIVVGGQVLNRKGDPTLASSTNPDYEFDYGRGRLKILPGGDNVDTKNVSREIIPGVSTQVNQLDVLGGTTGISADGKDPSKQGEVRIDVTYEFIADPENVAKLVQRMSQLGGPVVMRKNKKAPLGPDGSNTGVSAQEGSTAHTIIPKKVEIVEQADKPDEVKVNIEARRASETG